MSEVVLSVQNLHLVFETIEGRYNALNGVDLDVEEGQVIGLVGESGCGKSSLALATIGLVPTPPAKIMEGSKILFKGQDLLALGEKEMEKIRGTGMSMIFQEPLTCLNPVFTIGDQLTEAVTTSLERRNHPRAIARKEDGVKQQVVSWLRKVGIPDPEAALAKYPHELSGGMRQRVMIAMAMAPKPSLMLADEPTSAVDVTTQAQILRLIRSLIAETQTSVLFISHDLAVVAQIADRVAVMYAGLIMEEASVHEMFERPLHPYTQALLASFPGEEGKNKDLETIPGSVPSLTNIPAGCPFHPRCRSARDECSKARPQLKEVSPRHKVACVLY
jgi:peptide/nickel transport system ATP-binding protein